MKRHTAVTLLILFALSTLFCSTSFAAQPRVVNETRYSIGYRTDILDWNIAGGASGPNILSELEWTDLKALEFKVTSTTRKGKLYMRTSADYAFIFSGSNQDSDYDGDDRTLEYSRSNNEADIGSLWDISGGIGRLYRREAYDFALLGGLSMHKQNLRMTDGFQTLCTDLSKCPSPGPFGGLDSSYKAMWIGPWIGIDFNHISKDKRLKAFATTELHLAYFYAEADWNLISDFEHPKSFEHEAYGTGIVVNVGLDYEATERLSMGIGFDVQSWVADDGTIKFFMSPSGGGGVAVQRLNEVNWFSTSLRWLIRYRY
jgi:hypothetical protein